MTSVKSTFRSEVVGLARTVVASAIGGAFFGGSYALLADMPAVQVAKAWAVWHAAQMALLNLASILIKHDYSKLLATTVTSVLCTAVGVNEMKKRGFIGNRMIYFIVGVEVVSTLFFCREVFSGIKPQKPKSNKGPHSVIK